MVEYRDTSALLGKSAIRRRILGLIVAEPQARRHLREVARLAGTSAGTASRELQRLLDAGLVERSVEGRQVYYQARQDSVVFRSVADIVRHTTGARDVIARRMSGLAGVKSAVIFGSYAAGMTRLDSDVDLLVVGTPDRDELTGRLEAASRENRSPGERGRLHPHRARRPSTPRGRFRPFHRRRAKHRRRPVTDRADLADLAELVATGRLRPQQLDAAAMESVIEAAEQDVRAADAMAATFPAWAETMLYEAGLRCARAIVHAAGYRISTDRGHMTAIDAADAITAGEHHRYFVRLHRMRRTRHEFMYETGHDPSAGDLERDRADVLHLIEVAKSAVP